jgi:hypothetical protein
MATDILISCFATPSPETLNSIKSGPNSLSDFMPQDGFSNGAPKLINVGVTLVGEEQAVTEAYAREADKYKGIGGGSIIKGILQTFAPGVNVRTVSLLTFSGGYGFALKVIANGEGKYLDGLYLMDGITFYNGNNEPKSAGLPSQWQPWVDFGNEAKSGKRVLFNYYTDIAPAMSTVQSTAASAALLNEKVFSSSTSVGSGVTDSEKIDAVSYAGPPPPKVQIYSKTYNKTTTWEQFPHASKLVLGNYISYGAGGTQPTDHIFAATYGLSLAWKSTYRPRMNLPDDQLALASSDLQPSVHGGLPTGGPGWPTLISVVAGTAAGYVLGKLIFKGRKR